MTQNKELKKILMEIRRQWGYVSEENRIKITLIINNK